MAQNFDPIIYFENLMFSSGTEVALASRGVVVIVGPNNVGKSTALGEVTGFVREQKFAHNGKLNQAFASGGMHVASEDEFRVWFEQFAESMPPDPVSQPNAKRYRNWNSQIVVDPATFHQRFQQAGTRGELQPFLCSNGMMASFEGPAPDVYGMATNVGSDNKQFEKLYFDPISEAKIRKVSEEIFRVPVGLTRSGRTTALHYGQLPQLDNPPTDAQREALRLVPKVNEQGQGVTSLLNLAITLELGEEPVVVLDEPDAHLHPPQAKHAGRFVAERGKRSQVFIATHSIDFLLGILDKGVDTTIIRLDRRDGVQSVAILDKAELKKSWSDPVVRFSGALAGIMHRGVVLCEGDGDCRYFEVALDHLDNGSPHDLRFVQSGGKAGCKKLVRVLRTLSVPTVVVTDFDLLRDWSELGALYEATGGDSGEIKADWTEVDKYVNSKVEKRTLAVVLGEFDAVAKEIDSAQTYTQAMREKLQESLKTQGGWTEAKEHGLTALKGEAATACAKLLKKLRTRGIHVLPFGELESFHRDAPAGIHGASWTTHVIEHGLYKLLVGEQAQFVRDIPTVCFGAVN